MHLYSLYIEMFRCLTRCEIAPESGINCIVGDNASGKSSFLESIYLIGRGKLLRQSRVAAAINKGNKALTVRASVTNDAGNADRKLACHVTSKSKQFKIDGRPAIARYNLISALPLQYMGPNTHRLLEEGPNHRRQFLDWGVFHVEHAFFPAWRRYRRALKQRNQALREGKPKNEIISWDRELVEQGELVTACRRRYINFLSKELPKEIDTLIGESDLTISFNSGWDDDRDLEVALAAQLDGDMKARFTRIGPHRADFLVSVHALRARNWISRGQQKLLIAALVLAQSRVLKFHRNVSPILLLDDFAAELGGSYGEKLADQITKSGTQAFVTFLNEATIPKNIDAKAMFHVEHGSIRAG